MSDRPTPRWLVGLLVVANVTVFAGIGWLALRRADGPAVPSPDALTSPPRAASVADGAGFDWSRRYAPDASPSSVRCEGCNLLLVSLDIFRPDHMPCHGYPRDTTPTLCAMEAHGARSDTFVVHAYQTPVSQMSLFTGRYPSSSGFVSFASQLPASEPYFPEALKAAGYQTVAMGSSFEVMTDMSSYQTGKLKFHREGLNPGLSFGRGFDRFVFTGNRNLPTDAIPWLRDARERPFFLWLILGTLHWPYGDQEVPDRRADFDPPGYAGALATEPSLGFRTLSRIFRGRLYDETTGRSTPLDDTDTAYVNARYDIGLRLVDRFLGELIASIPEELLHETVIALHGVHGEDLGEHGYFGHYDIYDVEVRNSLILLNPRHRAEGVTIPGQVEGVDLAPTLLDILGLPPLPGAQGRSVLPALLGGTAPERPAFTERIPLWEDIFRHRSQMPPAYTARIEAVMDREVVGDTGLRTPRWKLIHRKARAVEAEVSWWAQLSGIPVEREEWELYDLQADPGETRSVAAQEPAVLADLSVQLLAWEAAR